MRRGVSNEFRIEDTCRSYLIKYHPAQELHCRSIRHTIEHLGRAGITFPRQGVSVMRWPGIFLVGLLLASSGLLNAQASGGGAAHPFALAPAIPGNIKNAPFSADVITQYDRVLQNGNHVRSETQEMVYRDSQGRVRTETESASAVGSAAKAEQITIQDPVQHVVIRLYPLNKTANVYHLAETSATATNSTAPPPANRGSFISVRPTTPDGQPPASSVSVPVGSVSNPAAVRTESLGAKSIEGVNVTGTRTTRTIRAATKGGQQSIVSVTEAWFSPDLQMMILSETDDGHAGHSTMKVVNIVRAEPTAELFQIPAEYTVKEATPATAGVK